MSLLELLDVKAKLLARKVTPREDLLARDKKIEALLSQVQQLQRQVEALAQDSMALEAGKRDTENRLLQAVEMAENLAN